ncbi:conserved protein of unknown function [Legionella fallonii LLAP-10]|uniref:Putative DNA-binding domain-containing protein n=1 Tax=Legionella fallonii LLAP-10 TaxID=1212491 RepID=A0A098G8K9_9GAMM|nr:conserved protein of unknown function [Legionella fallonii LLAP-10]
MKQENPSIISTLEHIQNEFVKGVLSQKSHSMVQYIHHNHIAPESRLSIYRNNIMQNLRYALENTFPYIWELVGKECADNLAYRFCQKLENFPVSHCLDDWGGKFPQFLQEIEAIKDLVYLQDIAELEWLKHKSFRADDFKVLNPLKLQNQLNNCLEELCLVFNPSVYLFSSPYVLKDIIDLIENPNETINVILQREPCYAIINRQTNHVVTHWLSESQFYFFNSIKNGFTLMQSYELILKTNPDFDLVASLQMLLKNDLFSNYRKTAIKKV